MNQKEKKELETMFGTNFYIIECVTYSIGDTVSYLFKTILSIFNKSNSELEIVILKRKRKKEKPVLDLQTK